MVKVFVYGTLKQGYGNHRIIEGKPFLGPAVTLDRFEMINSGFPVLIPSDNGLPVKGEVYDIGDDRECLDRLDALEGEGVMYDRREIQVLNHHTEGQMDLRDNRPQTVSVYIGNPRYWADRPGDQRYLTDDNHYEWRRL